MGTHTEPISLWVDFGLQSMLIEVECLSACLGMNSSHSFGKMASKYSMYMWAFVAGDTKGGT